MNYQFHLSPDVSRNFCMVSVDDKKHTHTISICANYFISIDTDMMLIGFTKLLQQVTFINRSFNKKINKKCIDVHSKTTQRTFISH